MVNIFSVFDWGSNHHHRHSEQTLYHKANETVHQT